MKRTGLIIGIILLVVGVAVYAYFSSAGHHTIPLGGIGLAVLGALIAAGSAMMKPAGGKVAGQFKCEKCGMTFGSQAALDQHSKDKHGM
jgi:drug/metabolite transporter (DMT)-like permease